MTTSVSMTGLHDVENVHRPRPAVEVCKQTITAVDTGIVEIAVAPNRSSGRRKALIL
jgi:hypothetical protein